MSNLQVLARRCPVMGKALAVQSARTGTMGLSGAYGGTKAHHSKAGLHTTRAQQARPSEVEHKKEHCKFPSAPKIAMLIQQQRILALPLSSKPFRLLTLALLDRNQRRLR